MKEDLQERTFQFATRIVKLCRVLDDTPGVARTLAKQLLRSGTSIGANVEEGQGSQSKADFVSKYSIACKEARETHYWLRLLVASEVMPETRLSELIDESNQLIAILTTIIKKTKEANEMISLFPLHPSSRGTRSSPNLPSGKAHSERTSRIVTTFKITNCDLERRFV